MSIQPAWEDQAFTGLAPLSPAQENHYLQSYLPLVCKIVRQMAAQCSSVMDRQDMQQVALMGLLNALRRYGQPDDSFGGYAAQRIRGAILDELRSLDWRPRTLRDKCHQVGNIVRDLRKRLGYEPGMDELALVGVDRDSWDEYLALSHANSLASLDDLLATDAGVFAQHENSLERQYVIRQTLKEALDQLSEKERIILSLYYQKDMSLKEIAQILDLTEARICQINKKISHKIRQHFHPEN